jgi:hypothetical protein
VLPSLVETHNFEVISPYLRLTDILASHPDMVVICGTSLSAIEASLLKVPVITPSRHWWLKLPYTYHFNTCMPSIKDFPSCVYEQFIVDYCFNLDATEEELKGEASRHAPSLSKRQVASLCESIAADASSLA